MSNNTKDWIQYLTAVAMVAVGIGLSIASFAVLHQVHSSVLAFVGEAVSFAGAVFGISVYARSKSEQLERRLSDFEKRYSSNNDTHHHEKD